VDRARAVVQLAGAIAVEAEHSSRLGIDVRFHGADWPAIVHRVFGRIDPIAEGGREYRLSLPNVTVFEWLARQPAFKGRVAAIATWDAFRRIFNRERAGIDVIDGWDPPFRGARAASPRAALDRTVDALHDRTRATASSSRSS